MKALVSVPILAFILSTGLQAHPTGNIIVVKDHILWSYVCPVGDVGHHACVMIWDQRSEPKTFFSSEFTASDFTLYAKNEVIYLVESKYVNQKDIFETRILKARLGETPEVIWPWFEDQWKIGNNGIVMNSDDQVVFVNYPHVYKIDKGQSPALYFESPDSIKRIRPVENDQLLLLSDQNCWLTNHQGKVLKSWEGIGEVNAGSNPIERIDIFDVDYQREALLIAYWAKRKFVIIDPEGKQRVLKQHDAHWIPHWVAFYKDKQLLFASYLNFGQPAETIKPDFLIYDQGKTTTIWGER